MLWLRSHVFGPFLTEKQSYELLGCVTYQVLHGELSVTFLWTNYTSKRLLSNRVPETVAEKCAKNC